MIKKFRKKPVILEAVQWTGDNQEEIEAFVGKPLKSYFDNQKQIQTIVIPALEGDHVANESDWIFKGHTTKLGWHFWPVKDDYVLENYVQEQSDGEL